MTNFAAHRSRKIKLMAVWGAGQRLDIDAAHGPIVATACERVAERQAHGRAWSDDPLPLWLKDEEIQITEDAVVSSSRLMAYGPYALRRNDDGAQWREQMDMTRSLIRMGKRPEMMTLGTDQPLETKAGTRDRLRELAAEHRQGRKVPPPEDRDIPEAT